MPTGNALRPVYRSLLQKAVRRGDVALVKAVATRLCQIGDLQWLAKRTAVICFEECWPLIAWLPEDLNFDNPIRILLEVAQSIKFKDAAGLGTLALAFSSGDKSVLTSKPDDYHIIVVSEAIKRPNDFWQWALTNCEVKSHNKIAILASHCYCRGGWPWDKAFMQAATYLAIIKEIPRVSITNEIEIDCPLWVAFDKHTPQGKKALEATAFDLGIPTQQLFWLSFYLESSLTNAQKDSLWWSQEISWRLGKHLLSWDEAKDIWDRAFPIIVKSLEPYTEVLEADLSTHVVKEEGFKDKDTLEQTHATLKLEENKESTQKELDKIEPNQLNIF